MRGTLYVVGTPIGNLADLTRRAETTLKSVDLIAAEDTRVSRKLMNHYDIQTPLIAYHDKNERSQAEKLVSRLIAGENIAIFADAGTPVSVILDTVWCTQQGNLILRLLPFPVHLQ